MIFSLVMMVTFTPPQLFIIKRLWPLPLHPNFSRFWCSTKRLCQRIQMASIIIFWLQNRELFFFLPLQRGSPSHGPVTRSNSNSIYFPTSDLSLVVKTTINKEYINWTTRLRVIYMNIITWAGQFDSCKERLMKWFLTNLCAAKRKTRLKRLKLELHVPQGRENITGKS